MNKKIIICDSSISDFSDIFRLISNSNLITKNDTIYTNSNEIYHYCKYCRIKYHWLMMNSKKDWEIAIKNCDEILILEEKDSSNKYIEELANKHKKNIQIINI